MLDPAMSPWDCAPMLPILREAGGHFSDWTRRTPTIHGADAVGTNARARGADRGDFEGREETREGMIDHGIHGSHS